MTQTRINGTVKPRAPTQTIQEVQHFVSHFEKQRWPPPCRERLKIADRESYPFIVEIKLVEEVKSLRDIETDSGAKNGAKTGANEGLPRINTTTGSKTSVKQEESKKAKVI